MVEKNKRLLTQKEKKYLENVIKPFKDRVSGIEVNSFWYDKCWLAIHIFNDCKIEFPLFKKGTIYRGIELDRNYTLEELGLFKAKENKDVEN